MSDLTLARAEVERLAGLVRVFVTPLDYATDLLWSAAVSQSLCSVLGTDRSGVVLKANDRPAMVGTFGENATTQYLERWYATMTGDARRRAARMTSWVRADVWAFAELQKSAYYHEWCVPHGNQDSAGMCVYLAEGGEIAAYINASQPGTLPRGGRHALLLELLQPSLAAGVAALRAVGQCRDDARLLDSTRAAVAFFALDGRLIHAVPRFGALLRDARDGPVILGASRKLLRDTVASFRRAGTAIPSPELVVQAPNARYVLHVSLVDSAVLGADKLCIVTVEAPRLERRERYVRDRFGVTAREAEVALLLAAGHSNALIARTLGISTHTARHHTERVFEKMGVASRSQVAAKLMA